MSFTEVMKSNSEKIEVWLQNYLQQMDLPPGKGVAYLKDSVAYSLSAGGKRFRPSLSLLVGEIYSCPSEKILPFASAVEMIHTYSLIHDDLPCMDNDDVRRGKPTNHRVYGEAFALLAGDALLTEAFLIAPKFYSYDPELSMRLVEALSRASGARGMVGGQAIDLKSEGEKFDLKDLLHLHHMKTGRLIQVAIEGAAMIAKLPLGEQQILHKFGEHLGLAFQVADDVLDADRKEEHHKSFVGLLGVEGTKELLVKVSEEAIAEVRSLSRPAKALEAIIEYNLNREV